MCMDTGTPAAKFGGTWEQIAKGQVLVGVNGSDTDFNASGKTGGEKTHTLITEEIPGHIHQMGSYTNNVVQTGTGAARFYVNDTGTSGKGWTGSAGGGAGHNNMPPYITCYIWKRTA